jgi:hypothetical protein
MIVREIGRPELPNFLTIMVAAVTRAPRRLCSLMA